MSITKKLDEKRHRKQPSSFSKGRQLYLTVKEFHSGMQS